MTRFAPPLPPSDPERDPAGPEPAPTLGDYVHWFVLAGGFALLLIAFFTDRLR